MRVFFDAEHFFDGYRVDPEFTLRVLEAAAEGGAETVVLCDTNGGSLPHEVQQATAEVVAHLGRRRPDRHPHPERLGLRGGQLGRRRPGRGHPAPGHGQRLRRAHRQRQPHDLHPRPRAQARDPLPARGADGAPHRGEPPRGRAGQPPAPPGRPLRRVVGLRPQGRAPHLGPGQGRRRHLRARRPRRGGQPHPGAGQRSRRPGRHGHEGGRDGRRARRAPPPPPSPRSSSSARPSASSTRRPTPRSSCSMREATRLAPGVLRPRGLPGHHLPPERGAGRRADRATARRWSTPRRR